MILFAASGAPSGKSRWILLGAVVVALAAAALLTLGRGGSNGASGEAGDTLLVCTQDGHSFTLTADEYAEQLRSSPDTSGSPDMTRGEVPKIKCPKCGQRTAVIGMRCPKDQTAVASYTGDGRPPRCPKCGGNPFTSGRP